MRESQEEAAVAPPAERVEQVFDILCLILQDGGLPPASGDRRECKAGQDRAALRKCAAIHLFRLCDARSKLEANYLDPARWQILARAAYSTRRKTSETPSWKNSP